MATRSIEAPQAHHDTEVSDALLVCAYDSDEKFENNHLQGAVSLAELQSQEDSLTQEREIIFYCA